MNEENRCCEISKSTALAAGVVGACVIVALLVAVMRQVTAVPDAGAARAEERFKNLEKLKQSNGDVLVHYGVVDPARGIYRMPVEKAVSQVLEEWSDPAVLRSNLLVRADKLTAPLPKAPEQKSQFE